MDPSVFRNSQLLRLFIAQMLSQVCDRLLLVTALWIIARSHSSEWAPWFVAAGALPHLLLASWAPRWIERWGALRTVIGTDAARGLILLLAVPAFRENAAYSPEFRLALLFLLNLGVNSLGALFNPALLTLPSRITLEPGLARKGTALVETCISLSAVLAPAISVGVFGAFGLAGLVAISGASYLVAALVELGIKEVAREVAQTPDGPLPNWRGLAGRDPLLVILLLGFLAINLFLGPLLAFIPLYARHVYQGELSTVALLEGALGGGTLVGSFALALLSSAQTARAIKRIVALLGIVSLAYLAFTLTTSPMPGALALAALGIALAVANIEIVSFFQVRPKPAEVPLIMSWVNLISVASLPLSMGATGWILSSLDSTVQPIASGAALLCLAATVAFSAAVASRPAIQGEPA